MTRPLVQRFGALLAGILLCGATGDSQAHPDASHTLAEIEEHLAVAPGDAGLHQAKAEVVLSIKLIPEARKAIDEAERIDARAPGLGYLRAKWTLATGDALGARRQVEEFLRKEPAHRDGQRLLRRLAADGGDLDTAIQCAEAIFTGEPAPPINDFTVCASLYLLRHQAGDDDRALAALDQGLRRIGCLTGLHYMACEIEVRLRRYDAALRRIDALAQRFHPRLEFETRRAEILVAANRPREARVAYDNAVALLEAFPARLKQSSVFEETRTKLVTARDAL